MLSIYPRIAGRDDEASPQWLRIPGALLSDPALTLQRALGLPTFT